MPQCQAGDSRPCADELEGGFEAALRILSEEHRAQVAHLKAELARLKASAVAPSAKAQTEESFAKPLPSGPRIAVAVQQPLAVHEALDDIASTVLGSSPTGDFPPAGTCQSACNSSVRTPASANRKGSTLSYLVDIMDSSGEEKPSSRFPTLEMIQDCMGGRRISWMMSEGGSFTAYKRRTWHLGKTAFESLFALSLVSHTLLLGVKADTQEDWVGWAVINTLYAAGFLLEVLWQMRVHGVLAFLFGKHSWKNRFAVASVMICVLEAILSGVKYRFDDGHTAWCTALARKLRVGAALQVVRVLTLDMFSELKGMLQGTLGGMRTLLWSIVLITIPVYFVSLLLRETVGRYSELGRGAEYFDSVPGAFLSVFRCIVMGECADASGRPIFLHVTRAYGWGYALIYCTVSIFMWFGLFNVIMAMFVENVVKAAKSNERLLKGERLRDQAFFAQRMTQLISIMSDHIEGKDPDSELSHAGLGRRPLKSNAYVCAMLERAKSIEITHGTLEALRSDKRVQSIFMDLDIANEDQFNLFRTLDVDGGGTIDIEEFCSGISKLRGDACRSDIVGLNVMIKDMKSEFRSAFALILRRLSKQEQAWRSSVELQDVSRMSC